MASLINQSCTTSTVCSGVALPALGRAAGKKANGVVPGDQQQGSKFKVLDGGVPAAKLSVACNNIKPFANPVPRRMSGGTHERPGAGGARSAGIVWFRNDLRLHDNEALATANAECSSILPVYCFDPRDYGQSEAGFDRAGPYRTQFLLQCVADLRSRLADLGTQLIVRLGHPEQVLAELVRATGAGAVFCQSEVTAEEAGVEAAVRTAVEGEGARLRASWGSTLHHPDDLPFRLADLPPNYGGFRAAVADVPVRAALDAPASLKPRPLGAAIEPGELPTAQQLGLSPQALAHCQADKHALGGSLQGGETEALRRLQAFAAQASRPLPAAGRQVAGYGANFSCQISPWLALGCLSPRRMHADLQPVAQAQPSAARDQPPATGLTWLTFELLWRDFFRFITWKCASMPLPGQPALAQAGSATPSTATLALA